MAAADRPAARRVPARARRDRLVLLRQPPRRDAAWEADLRYEMNAMQALPHTVVYVEGGYSDSNSVRYTARILNAIGITRIRGFFTNDTHEQWTINEVRWATKISKLTHGAHFIVNTAQNGHGPLLNPHPITPGRRGPLQPARVAASASPTPPPRSYAYADAFMWTHPPGNSSGCGGGPPGGVFWPARAIQLAQNANAAARPRLPEPAVLVGRPRRYARIRGVPGGGRLRPRRRQQLAGDLLRRLRPGQLRRGARPSPPAGPGPRAAAHLLSQARAAQLRVGDHHRRARAAPCSGRCRSDGRRWRTGTGSAPSAGRGPRPRTPSPPSGPRPGRWPRARRRSPRCSRGGRSAGPGDSSSARSRSPAACST